jgi:uncharacterized protein YndB with AHSA1/START domain
MNSTGDEPTRILGSLRSAGGMGIVRIENHFETSVDDLWAAVTEPERLARWYGEVEGDLRVGGDFSVSIESDGWRGRGHVDACERPERLLVTTREADESFEKGEGAPPFDEVIEATLAAEGGSTVLVLEIRGLPLDKLEYYGAGWQIHTEHLAAHIAGHEWDDAEARWAQLVPPYRALAAELRG